MGGITSFAATTAVIDDDESSFPPTSLNTITTNTTFDLSEEQREIIAQIRPPPPSSFLGEQQQQQGAGRIIRITAGAGAGKTTTLLHLAEQCATLGHSYLTYLTFTKATAEDTRRKIMQRLLHQQQQKQQHASKKGNTKNNRPFVLDARTLHSASYRALTRYRNENDDTDDNEVENQIMTNEYGDMERQIAQVLRHEIDQFLKPCHAEISQRPNMSISERNKMCHGAEKQVIFFITKTLSQFCKSSMSLQDLKNPKTYNRVYYPAKLFHMENPSLGRGGPAMGFRREDYGNNGKRGIGWYADQAAALFEVHFQNIRSFDLEMKRAQLLNLEIEGSVLLVDECQDCDACQMAWVKEQASTYGKQVVCVGDAAQTIFGFRGAKSEYLMNIGNNNCQERSGGGHGNAKHDRDASSKLEVVSCHLTQSWRFGPQIAMMANLILFAKENSPQTPSPLYSKKKKQWEPYRLMGAASCSGTVTEESLMKQFPTTREPFTLLAHSNAELFEAALMMLGFDCGEPNTDGDDVKKERISLGSVDTIKGDQPTFHVNGKGDSSGSAKFKRDMAIIERIHDLFVSRNTSTVLSKREFPEFNGEPHTWDSFRQQVELRELTKYSTPIAIVERYGCKTIEALDIFRKDVLGNPCKAEEADIILSTIHSAKGMEWDNVQVYSDVVNLEFRQPKPNTKCEFNFKSYGDDVNLLYVACTRAKKVLSVPSHVNRFLSECDIIHAWMQNPERENAPQPTVFGKKMTFAETLENMYKDIVGPLRHEYGLSDEQRLGASVLCCSEQATTKCGEGNLPEVVGSGEADNRHFDAVTEAAPTSSFLEEKETSETMYPTQVSVEESDCPSGTDNIGSPTRVRPREQENESGKRARIM